MKGIRVRTFVIFALAGLSGAALLQTSQRVQQAEEELTVLQAEIAHEEDAMRVLRAEWEYLNRPSRLERLANEFLDLAPPAPDAMPDALMNEASGLPEKAQEEDNHTLPANFNTDAPGGDI